MLKIILTAIPVIVVIFLIIVALQPSDFRVTRSLAIAAPPAAVFPHVNELQKWEAWSPWAKLDPRAKSSFEGPAAGQGAAMSWAGDSRVGEGRMTILESRTNELVRFKLEFLKPFKATNTAEFAFKSEGGQTTVTWSMWGKNDFAGKTLGLIMNCDKMVGGQFETGLAQMKSVAESAGK